MIYAKKQTQHPTMSTWHPWRVFPRNFTHVFCCKPASPEALDPNHAGTTCSRDQWYGKAVCSSTCAVPSGGLHLGETNSPWKPGNEISVDSYCPGLIEIHPWLLFGSDIFLEVILLSGSSNAKGIFLMVKRNLAVAHNCHSIYCLGLVVCVASLSCFVLSWIWPGWSSKQSCETWGGGYCCYC